MPTIAYNTVSNLIASNLPTGSPAGITAINHREVEIALLAFAESQWLQGDIKEIDCTQQYIIDNFEQTGANKGRGIVGGPREGWAICNGYNGTKNRTGRVSVAWGDVTPLGVSGEASTFPNISPAGNPTSTTPVIGGQKDAVVVSHSHALIANQNWNIAPNQILSQPGEYIKIAGGAGGDSFNYALKSAVPVGGVIPTPTIGKSSTVGDSATDKNIQPYIVTLFIQKL